MKMDGSAVRLTRCFIADFADGSLIITQPGSYRLCEDIIFNANPPSVLGTSPAEAFDPNLGAKYDENTFGLGFFAAIVIASDGVDLYLDGHTLQQSEAHALMQRFFALVELSSSPFIRGAGPAQFVGDDDDFYTSQNVGIYGPGVLGRSAHHGTSSSRHIVGCRTLGMRKYIHTHNIL